MNRLFLTAALLLSLTAPSAAGVIVTTDFSANGSGITSLPGDNLASAAAITVSAWKADAVPVSLGGLVTGDAVSVTNPILTLIGSSITISWDAGTFTDKLILTSASFVGSEAPGIEATSCVVTSAAEVPIILPPTLAAKLSPVPRR